MAFWTEAAERHHFKIHKAIAAIVLEDLPATWLDDGRFSLEGGLRVLLTLTGFAQLQMRTAIGRVAPIAVP